MSIDARRYVEVLAAGTPPGTQAETDLAAATLAGAIAGDEAGREAGRIAGAQAGTEVASEAGAAAGAAAGEIAGAAAGTGAGATAGAAAGTTAGAAAGSAAAGALLAARTISAAGLATGGGTLAADRTITVTAADQAQAEAGAASTVAMTPQGATQHFNARVSPFMRTVSLLASPELVRAELAAVGLVELAAGVGAALVGFLQAGAPAVMARDVLDKLREAPSADDFGAIGDGTLHTVLEWIIPGALGRYANLAAVQADYPAVTSSGDSIDAAAIQKGWDVVSASGGGDLGLRAGADYIVKHTAGLACITAKSNVALIGSNTTIKLASAAGACAIIYSGTTVVDVRVEGITFDGNNPTVLTDTYGIRMEDITRVTVDNCEFQNLRLDPVLMGEVTRAEQVTIQNSVFRNIGVLGVGANGVRFYHNRGVKIDNCYFYDFITSPIDTNPTPGGDPQSNIVVTDCVLINDDVNWIGGRSAISLLAHSVVCENCLVVGGGHIVVHDYDGSGQTTRSYRIIGNDTYGTTSGIIIHQGENSEIIATGNTVNGFKQHGIQVINTSGVVANNVTTISSNTIVDTSTDFVYTNSNEPVCILFANANNFLCFGNQCISARFAGIWSAGSSTGKIYGNRVPDQQGHASTDLPTFNGGGIIVSAGGFGPAVAVNTVTVEGNDIVNFLTTLAGSPTTNMRTGGIVAYNDTGGAVTMHNIIIKNNNLIGGNGIGVHTTALDSVRTSGNETIDCLGGGEVDVGSVLRLANVLKGSYTAAPTTGAHTVGTIALNSAPVPGGPWGWICSASGTPGTWGPLYGSYLTGSATYDAPSIPSMTAVTTTVTVTGAAVGDFVQGSVGVDLAGLMTSWEISAPDTATLTLFNPTAGALNPVSTTIRARVQKA